LIELGALICTPKKPRCLECPVFQFCQAFKANAVSQIPAPKPRAKVKIVQAVALLVHHQGRVLLELRPKNGLLGGLYGVPLEPIATTDLTALENLCEKYALTGQPTRLGSVSHTMTHRQFEIAVFALESNQLGLALPSSRAVANLDRKILVLLEQGLFVTSS
jgi:A/G-specific adenine glycosylase